MMWGERADRWIQLAELFVDKVSIQKDILRDQLGGIYITEADRREIQHELDLVNKRWESGRSQDVVGKDKRPLLASKEWVEIQAGIRLGWEEWGEMDRAHQWKRFEDLGLLRRRPVRKSTEEMGGET